MSHLLGVEVGIEPLTRIEDALWRWHVGLAMNDEQVVRLKPQNLLLNLPLARQAQARPAEEPRGV